MDLWDDDACAELSSTLASVARDSGALIALPFALNYVAAHQLFAGNFDGAAILIEEADGISEATGHARLADFSVLLAAWRGREAQTVQLRDDVVEEATARGEGAAIVLAEWSLAVLYNGLGNYEAAVGAAQRAVEHEQLGFAAWVLPELIEAAVHAGRRSAALTALEQLTERASPSRTAWAAGIEARSAALLSEGAAAEAHYQRSIDCLRRSRIVVHLGRAHLIYGEWLRRTSRRTEARHQLEVAHQLLEGIGAEAFAERARRELLATGGTVRRSQPDLRRQLTDQELLIAGLARDGRSNPEIAAQLFLSRRTVEWHLQKVFSKLGITSRQQLQRVLPGS
jgi:ATP/maltotriose-dependent transcriptional regulator MalT